MPNHYDVIVRNTTIVDGSGNRRYTGSVGIRSEKIAAVGMVEGDAARIIDGAGLITSPGFVDPHSHADLNILQEPLAENLIMQGVTTFIGGNCGHCRAPLRGPHYATRWNEYLGLDTDVTPDADWRTFCEYLDKVESAGFAPNFIPLAGHGAIRLAVMGEDFKRKATPLEIKEMKAHLREALQNGAFGLSAGMDYEGDYADPDAEVVELLKLVQEVNGLFAPHTRNADYRWRVDDTEDFGYGRSFGPYEDAWIGRYHGIVEAIETAMLANKVRTHIAHFPPAWAIFQPHPESLERAIARATLEEYIDKPRSQGLDISFNTLAVYLHPGARSHIINSFYNPMVSLPQWLRTLPRDRFIERLGIRSFRDRLKEVIYSGTFKFGMIPPRTDPYWMDCFRIVRCKIRGYEGKTVGEIARSRSPHRIMDAVYTQSIEAVFDMLAADPDTTWEGIYEKRATPAIQEIFFSHSAGYPCMDSASLAANHPEDSLSQPPPFYFGAFPNYIDMMVKQKPLLTLEQAIHQACCSPLRDLAKIMDRGIIREGAFADVIIFDLDTLCMNGDYGQPTVPIEGMKYVLINGQIVYEKNKPTGAMPGKLLRYNQLNAAS